MALVHAVTVTETVTVDGSSPPHPMGESATRCSDTLLTARRLFYSGAGNVCPTVAPAAAESQSPPPTPDGARSLTLPVDLNRQPHSLPRLAQLLRPTLRAEPLLPPLSTPLVSSPSCFLTLYPARKPSDQWLLRFLFFSC